VNGAATLTGGTVQVNALTAAASDYRFNQLYTIVQANALTGTFANGSVFATVASNPNLKWRLRYDLAANAVVLQVQKNMEFNDGVAAGDTNTLAVANALGNSTTGNASDQWAATLNTITSLDTQQRVAAFRTFSGEALANVSTATISANNLFTDLLRRRVGDGGDALIGGGFASASLADVRTTSTAGNGFASALSGATLPGTDNGEAGNGGIWGQVYGGYQKLVGDGVHAGVDNTVAGVAMGLETRTGGLTAGIAGGVAQIDSDMNSRSATMSGNQYQLGGYLSYDAGSLFVAASGSWYSSDLNSRRTLALGTTTALATGDIHATGYSVGVSGGFRTELGNGLRLALIGSANKVRNQQDGFAESAAGGLGLQMASANRDLFTAGAELRLGAKVKTGAGVAMPWVSMGVRYNSGDLDTVGALRFSGAPSGTGGFGIEGVRMAPVLGTLGVGIDARASRNVRLGIALEGSAGENTREGRASVRVKIGF
jgi:fibronectin-binding autotransporter adhesin